MLKIKNLDVQVEKKAIIKNFNFHFLPNRTYVLMGPNGCGKSTLASTLMGHPNYKISPKSELIFKKTSLKKFDTHQRVQMGLFMTFQHPLALTGINAIELLVTSLSQYLDSDQIAALINQYSVELHLKQELLERSLNDGASGGERKKLEVLQAALYPTDMVIFDEIDTGVDVDALKEIGQFINLHFKDKTLLFITHNTRLLQHIKVDEVLMMKNGKIEKSGPTELAYQIEEKGFLKNNE